MGLLLLRLPTLMLGLGCAALDKISATRCSEKGGDGDGGIAAEEAIGSAIAAIAASGDATAGATELHSPPAHGNPGIAAGASEAAEM
jgi:hypothetical protein